MAHAAERLARLVGDGTSRSDGSSGAPSPVTISHEALDALAALAAVRLDGDRELRRLDELDAALQASQRLASRLTDFTRHAIAEYRGSHSAWNVSEDAAAVFDALREYALALDGIARLSKRIGGAS